MLIHVAHTYTLVCSVLRGGVGQFKHVPAAGACLACVYVCACKCDDVRLMMYDACC